MKHLPKPNRKVLKERLNWQQQIIPSQVLKIVAKSKDPLYSLQDKFKNFEDPLAYIHTEKIEKLKNEAHHTSRSLHQEMNEISQFSRLSKKQTLTPQKNKYNFRELEQRIRSHDGSLCQEDLNKKLRARNSSLRQKEPVQNEYLNKIKRKNGPLYEISNNSAEKYFNKKTSAIRQDVSQKLEISLNYGHIKLLDTPAFDQRFENVEFYQFLKKQKNQKNQLYVSEFKSSTNSATDRLFSRIKFPLIQKSIEFGDKSNDAFFDFENNLKFWQYDKSNSLSLFDNEEKKEEKKEEDILGECFGLNPKQISCSKILDFCMRKITIDELKEHKDIKKRHEIKIKGLSEQEDSGWIRKYNQMNKQYDRERLNRRNNHSTVKYINTRVQTVISTAEQGEFDEYFSDDTPLMLYHLGKLNQLRQKVLRDPREKRKLIIVENICQDIKQLLFKLLVMMFKGEKFHTMKDKKRSAPSFSFSGMMMEENKERAETRLLEFIYHNLQKFEVEMVDSIPKSELIKTYAQERDKNNKILQIIHSQ